MTDSGIKFRPVMGTEELIRNTRNYNNGWLYIATDTGAMYLDVENRRVSVGGVGGSGGTAGFVWADGGESQIIKLVEDDDDTTYGIDLSAIEDGVVPKKDQLILNSDGRFFRVLDFDTESSQIIATLIAVSGSGGGGGYVSNDDLELSVDSTTIARNFTLVAGKDYYVSVTATSTIDEDVTFYFTFTGANGYLEEKTAYGKSGEPCLFNVNFLPVNDNITMKVEADSDNTKMKVLPVKTVTNIKVVEMSIAKPANVNTASVNTGAAIVEYYLIGDPNLSETVHVYVDGIEIMQKEDSVSSSIKSVSIPAQSHGTHIVSLAVSTEIKDLDVYSEEISYEIAWKDPNDPTPIIWTGDYDKTVIQYEPFVVKYQVYDPATSGSGTNDPFTVYVYKNGVRVSEITRRYTPGEWLTLDLTELYEVGENDFSLTCGTTSKQIAFFVTTVGSRDLSIAQSDRLLMNLSATGRSNDEIAATRSDWSNGPYIVQFNNFNWYNNGWGNDDDGNGSYLSVANGASVSIPFRNYNAQVIQDFTFNNTENYTLELRFRIRNVQEYSTLVTTNPYYFVKIDGVQQEQGLPIAEIKARQNNHEDVVIVTDEDGNWVMDQKLTEKITKTEDGVCFKILNNNNYGLCVGTQEAYFRSKEGTTNVRYKEDEVINFSVVVSASERLASIYLNGILSGSLNLGNDSSSAFNCGRLIEINSKYCDIDIYKIRFFNTGLTMPEVIHNYIADIHDLTLYDQNQLVKEDPTLLSYTKLVEYNNKMLAENHPESLSMPYAVIEIIDNNTGMTNPNGGSHSLTDDLLPWKKGNNRYCKVTFVNPMLDAQYDAGLITDSDYKSHSPSYVCIGADINVQGTSSQGYPRRNFKTKHKSATSQKDSKKVKHDDWGWFYTGGPYKADWKIWMTGLDASGNEVSEEDRTAARDRCKFSKWKQDNPNYGTNKFTWKIDYMESSGTYNTGFANLVGNNIYSTHPLGYYHFPDLELEGLRTSVYGFPVLTFHKHSKPADKEKEGTRLEDEIYEYIGRYNLNQDKGSDELFGFSLDNEQIYVNIDPDTGEVVTELDPNKTYTHPTIAEVAECWEMTDNQGTWTSFSYPEAAQVDHFATYTADSYDDQNNLLPDPKLEVIRHFECRYHKDNDFIEVIAIDEAPYDLGTVNAKIADPEVSEEDKEIWRSINTIGKMNDYIISRWNNWEKFVTWCDSTDRSKANPEQDITPVEYQVSAFPSDLTGATTREEGTNKYVTFTKDTAAYRLEKFRNEFDKHLNLEYCAVYFVMTELLLCYDSRGKNMMMASYGPTEVGGEYIWFPIFYDIDTQLGLNNIGATLWDYDTDATLEQAFSTPSSVLWNNFADAFSADIANKYQTLRSDNKLNYNNIDGAYACDPNVFDSYAMQGLRPIIAIGLDEYYKYVAPSKTGYYDTTGTLRFDNNSYAYAVNGDRKLSRELLLRNRLNYMDSYWIAGDYTYAGLAQGGVRMRANANNQATSDKYLDSNSLSNLPSNAWPGEVLAPYPVPYYDATPNFEITPFLSQYVYSYNDKQRSSAPVKYQGTPVSVIALGVEDGYKKTSGMPEQIVNLPAEDYLSSLGDLSTKYLSQFTLLNGKRILDITIGSDAPDYFNGMLGAGTGQFNINNSKYLANVTHDLNPGRKTLLKSINLTNVTNLADPLDISGSEKLIECRILGTKIPYVTFAEGAPLDCIHLPWTVNKIDLVEATNLTRILTSKPVVWENDRENYTGLYIEDLTDSYEGEYASAARFHTNEQGVRQPNNINYINIVGGNLGYDSYRLLDKAIRIKEFEDADGLRLKINMEDVVWSPYLIVENGTPYDDHTTYYRLTEHSTFTDYTFTNNAQWKIDTLNGLVFTYNDNPQKSLITSTALLDKFIADYERALSSAIQESHYTNLVDTLGYPYLSGTIYINNTDQNPIDEDRITQVYGAIWKNLNIYAAYVNEAYVAKFVQRTGEGQDKQVDIKRYKQLGTVHPELTDVTPIYPNYDFKGWTLNPEYTIIEQDVYDALVAANNNSIINSSNINNLEFSAENDVFVFYAVYVPHPFPITFDVGDGRTVVITTPFNHVINLPTTVPYKDESQIGTFEKYAFLGYAKSETATRPLDMSKEKAVSQAKYFAIFKKTDVHKEPLGKEYLTYGTTSVRGKNGVTTNGWELGLNPNYAYNGKITLPSYIDGIPVVKLKDGTQFNAEENAPNGLSNDNGGRNHITHIFWDTDSGTPNIIDLGQYTFFFCNYLEYVEIPDSVYNIGTQAFANSSINMPFIDVPYIRNGAFGNLSSGITQINIGPNVEYLGNNAFSHTGTLQSIVIGTPTEFSKLNINNDMESTFSFFVTPVLNSIVVYTDNKNAPIWSYAGFTVFEEYPNARPTVDFLP